MRRAQSEDSSLGKAAEIQARRARAMWLYGFGARCC